jgi:Leucine-rich repeat (LRR) protein
MKNRLKEVTIAQLRQLKELNLTNNQLANVDLNDLQGLTSLNISNN